MKLSEMNTQEAAQVLLEIVEPVSRIANDDKLIEELEKLRDMKKKTKLGVFSAQMSAFIPALIGRHETDTYRIIAALNEKAVEDVKAQPMKQTFDDIRNVLDSDFMDFFS